MERIKKLFQKQSDNKVKVQLMRFEEIDLITKAENNFKHLKAISMPENISFIVEFISERLTSFIHHRNLKDYRSSISSFKEDFDTVSINIHLSENLSTPVKYEPQYLHWSHSQVTVYSGILKNIGEKSYHAYFSDDKRHDQPFVKLAMEEILNEAETDPNKYIIIERDNCSSQYKSDLHFYNL